MKIPNASELPDGSYLSLARIVSEDSQLEGGNCLVNSKSSKDS